MHAFSKKEKEDRKARMLKFCERIPMAPVSNTTKAGTTSPEGKTRCYLAVSWPTVLNIIAKNSLAANKNRKRDHFYCNSEVLW